MMKIENRKWFSKNEEMGNDLKDEKQRERGEESE